MKQLCFIISHRPDNRYLKRINALKSRYKLNLVFWNKTEQWINPQIEGVIVNEICIPANQTNPLKRIPQLILFINKAYHELLRINPDIVYIGNLDMLYIARKYKKRFHRNASIIYEIADLHRLIIDKQKGIKRLLSKILRRIEKKYSLDIDRLVLTSMKFYDVYYNQLIEKSKVIFLPNMPEDQTFADYIPMNRDNDNFTIGFIGWIRYKDQLKMLIRAADIAGINVLFAGTDGDGIQFQKYCENYPFVTFLGSFDYDEKIKELYDMIDCVYAVYDADWANVRVALPNKLYEAMICEKPIIVAKGTYLSELVKEYGVGVEVGHHSTMDLVEEINMLKTRGPYYKKFVDNCKMVKRDQNLSKYNRELIEKIADL